LPSSAILSLSMPDLSYPPERGVRCPQSVSTTVIGG
jgi:hypothetical protein